MHTILQRAAWMLWVCSMAVFADYDWGTNPGSGTTGDPYRISTAEQMASIGSTESLLDDHFILVNDINLSSYPFTNSPIAPDTNQTDSGYSNEHPFSGTLDGKGHCIRNLKIIYAGTRYNIGLVGLTTTSPWQIRNLGLENLTISIGNGSQYVGGFVGRGWGGSITGCYVTGSISAGTSASNMGGLAGMGSATNISNCYNECSVANGTGSSNTGGAVGYLVTSNGRLEKCYSIGSVNSGSTVTTIGALVGRSYGGIVLDCYYLNGIGPNNGIGIAQSASSLKMISTYPAWEFVDPTLGNQGYWRMRDGESDYPYLAWEFIAGDIYGDFRIDLLDFDRFGQSWRRDSSAAEFNWLCDLNGNEVIDLGDLRALCHNWLITY